jgi:hypothetical protein
MMLAMLATGIWSKVHGDESGQPKSNASQDASAKERVLLLFNGKIVKGIIRQQATGYVVTLPGGQMVLPFAQVRFEAEDLQDAYLKQRQSLPERSAAARVELARWCLTYALKDEARRELQDALKLDPGSSQARKMLQRLNDQLLATEELPTVVARNGHFSLLGGVTPGVAVETLGGLPREAAVDFTLKVQPLLVNRCAAAGCHAAGSDNEFVLQRTKLGKSPPKAHTEQNLAMVLARVDRQQPHRSPLLVKLRGEPDAQGVRQPHGGLTREQMATLRDWIESIAERPVLLKTSPLVVAEDDANAASDKALRGRLQGEPTPGGRTSPLDFDGDDFFRRAWRDLQSGRDDPQNLIRSTSDE